MRTRRRASNEREGYTAGTTTSGKDDQDHGNNDKGSCTNYIDHVDIADYDDDDDDHAAPMMMVMMMNSIVSLARSASILSVPSQ